MIDVVRNGENMVNKVIELVKEASKLCFSDNIEVSSKGSNTNFVTNVDIAIEEFMKENLPPLIEGSILVGEEGDNLQVENKYIWIVDPIDGTSNFIRGYNLSAISVGLLEDGFPVLGVVYNPFTKDLYYASKGNGAFYNGERIHVSDRDFNHSILCTAYSLYDKRYAPPCFRILERVYPMIDDQRRLGACALELTSIASGRAELYFEIRVQCWDCCGALAILEESGGFWAINGSGHTLTLDAPFTVVVGNTKENFEKFLSIVNDELSKYHPSSSQVHHQYRNE